MINYKELAEVIEDIDTYKEPVVNKISLAYRDTDAYRYFVVFNRFAMKANGELMYPLTDKGYKQCREDLRSVQFSYIEESPSLWNKLMNVLGGLF